MRHKKKKPEKVRLAARWWEILTRLSKYEYILLLIIIVGAFFRFYDYPHRYGFDFDASRDAIITYLGVTQFRIPPLGPASALGPFHFGPFYYYQLIATRLLLPVTYAPWISIALASLIAIGIGYKIGEKIGEKKLGLIIAGFIALSPAQIGSATGLSNPDVVILPAFLTLWLFIKHLKEALSWRWSFFFGLSLGLGISAHFQMLPLLVLPVVAFFFVKEKLRYSLSVLSGLGITLVPFLLYDSTHGFRNSRGFLFYLTEGRKAVYIPNSWKIYLFTFWPKFLENVSGLPIGLSSGILIVAGISIVKKLSERNWSHPLLITGGVFVLECLFLRYISSRESYYLLYLQPFVFLFLSVGLWWIWKQKFGMVLGGIFISVALIILIRSSVMTLRPPESHAQTVTLANYIHSRYVGKKVKLYDCSDRVRGMVMGTLYLLEDTHKTSHGVVPLGIYDRERCPEELLTSSRISQQMPADIVANNHDLISIQIVEFRPEQLSSLERSGWKQISLDTVYTDAVEKWLK